MEINQVISIFDEVGILLQRKLIDIDLAIALFGGTVKAVWEAIQPIVEVGRKQWERRSLEGFEYLYNEVKKREQQLAKTK